jgi:hypothetical protein
LIGLRIHGKEDTTNHLGLSFRNLGGSHNERFANPLVLQLLLNAQTPKQEASNRWVWNTSSSKRGE